MVIAKAAKKIGRYYSLAHRFTANKAGVDKILLSLQKELYTRGIEYIVDGYVTTFERKSVKGRIQATIVRDDEWSIEIRSTNKVLTEILYTRLRKELLPKRLQR